jgi:hypothetical protein
MIAGNSLILSLDRYPQPQEEVDILALMNAFFTIFFACEMCVKMVGLGILKYLGDAFNRFDVLIVIGSIYELYTAPPAYFGGIPGESGGGVSALRCFRVFRLLKLLKEVESLRALLVTVIGVMVDVGTFGVLLVMFIYIFALAGMQILANRLRFDPWTRRLVELTDDNYITATVPRANFDSLRSALMAVLQILTGEDWPTIWYDARLAAGSAGMFYVVVVVAVANFVVLNLFVAMLIGGFEEKLHVEEMTQVGGERGGGARGEIGGGGGGRRRRCGGGGGGGGVEREGCMLPYSCFHYTMYSATPFDASCAHSTVLLFEQKDEEEAAKALEKEQAQDQKVLDEGLAKLPAAGARSQAIRDDNSHRRVDTLHSQNDRTAAPISLSFMNTPVHTNPLTPPPTPTHSLTHSRTHARTHASHHAGVPAITLLGANASGN